MKESEENEYLIRLRTTSERLGIVLAIIGVGVIQAEQVAEQCGAIVPRLVGAYKKQKRRIK